MRSPNISSGNIAIIFVSFFVVACGLARGQNVERISLLVDYESGYGGAVYPVYNPYVFFKNGAVAKEPKVAIDEIDLKRSLRITPRGERGSEAAERSRLHGTALTEKGKRNKRGRLARKHGFCRRQQREA